MRYSIEALVHLISQLYAPTDDGQPSEDKFLLCGPTCVAIAERYLLGPAPTLVSPDTIKDRILGQGATGYTYINQLSDYLGAHGFPNHWTSATADEALDVFRHNLAIGRPNITLFYWDLVNLTGGHFCLTVTIDDDRGTFDRGNPWTDTFETLTLDQFRRDYEGYYLQLDCAPSDFQRVATGTTATATATGTTATPPTVAGADSTGRGAGAVAPKQPRYRVLYDGALHSQPTQDSPVTYGIQKGWEVVAVGGDSAPWISVTTLNGHWGWTTRVELERLP